jgi:hypothetical protein
MAVEKRKGDERQKGFYTFDEAEARLLLNNYEEIPLAEEIWVPGSYNLEAIYMQYESERLMETV